MVYVYIAIVFAIVCLLSGESLNWATILFDCFIIGTILFFLL